MKKKKPRPKELRGFESFEGKYPCEKRVIYVQKRHPTSGEFKFQRTGKMDWLEDYLDYTSPQEAPEIFHFWSGCAIIASVLNRRVWMSRRAPTGVVYYENYPGQLSPMLIAGSGKAKKSTAINIAKSFMKEAGVKVYDGKITPEQLLAKLAGMEKQFGAAILTAVASELSGFLGKQSYNDGLIDILIKLADCEAHPYETRQNTFPLTTVCFTLFSGSTPIGLSKAIPPQAQEHGFLSRYPWIYSDKSGKIESLPTTKKTSTLLCYVLLPKNGALSLYVYEALLNSQDHFVGEVRADGSVSITKTTPARRLAKAKGGPRAGRTT